MSDEEDDYDDDDYLYLDDGPYDEAVSHLSQANHCNQPRRFRLTFLLLG